MAMTSLDALRQAKEIAGANGIEFTATERQNRVIVRLEKGKHHWVNECRDDEPAGVWLDGLKRGIDYLCRNG